MHPAALMPSIWKNLLQRGPEAQGSVADGQFGACTETALLQVQQQLLPRDLALALAVYEADEFLLALCGGTDHDEHAGPLRRKTHVEVDAVGPQIDVALAREIAPTPRSVFLLPDFLETHDVRSAESRGPFAENGREHLREVAGGDTLEVEHRDQGIERGAASHIAGQDATGEAMALPAIIDARFLDRKRTGTGEYLA